LQISLFDGRDMAAICSPDFPGERLIVCRNRDLARERARKREDLIKATERNLAKLAAAVARKNRPVRGAAKIGVKVGAVLDKHKMAKHFEITIADAHFGGPRPRSRLPVYARLLSGVEPRARLAPMLYDDDDRQAAEASRATPVAKAQRSPEALAKSASGRTAVGAPSTAFRPCLPIWPPWRATRSSLPSPPIDPSPSSPAPPPSRKRPSTFSSFPSPVPSRRITNSACREQVQ
jgi:hypothetical protein